MTRYEAFINRHWSETGILNLIVARVRGLHRVEVGVFLIDCWCLGVKDAVYRSDETEATFEEFILERLPEGFRERIHPACAKKLIHGAVTYAEQLGFAPHHEFRKARRVLGGIDATACMEKFTFGKDGKPFYVASESDPPERINRVLAVLKARCGEDGFDYLVEESLWGEDDLDGDEEVAAFLARENLLEFFEAEPDDAPDFFEFSGMVTALHVCPEMVSPNQLLERLWGPDGRTWENREALQEFLDDLQVYWNDIVTRLAKSADAPPQEAWPLDIFDDRDAAASHRAAALISWCRGFFRATSEWHEAWGSALTRPDLAPHWAIVRAWANPEAPESEDVILEAAQREAPEMRGQTLPLAIVALYRSLRLGRVNG